MFRSFRIVLPALAVVVLGACTPVQPPAARTEHYDDFGTPVGGTQVPQGGTW